MVWDDVDACSILQVEQFEGFRHFWVLRRYLDIVGYEPAITDEELVGHRERNLENVRYTAEDRIPVLVNFTWSEHFAGYFFMRVAEQAKEPVLAKLAKFIAGDEFRHAEGGFRILQNVVNRDKSKVKDIVKAANEFRHYGNDVTDVPISLNNDFDAILKVVKKTQRICGVSLADFSLEAYEEAS
ncbi:ferritin-like domain-containing protein [Thiolapillus sp.]|uniref:ferritin-like domain-containing protein n=1 Tax=Thiolapillus sp. TaxID=2017437 RepID=UPI0025D40E35|nr:ferritin-like domain-containing protein [Thiolapillus sp.]